LQSTAQIDLKAKSENQIPTKDLYIFWKQQFQWLSSQHSIQQKGHREDPTSEQNNMCKLHSHPLKLPTINATSEFITAAPFVLTFIQL